MLYQFMKRSTAIFATAIILTYTLINSLTPIAYATFPEDWMDTAYNPTLESQWTVDQATYTENTTQPYNQCTQRTFTTRPARTGQTQQTISRCWYETAMGLVSESYAVAKGGNIAGLVTGRTNNGTTTMRFYQTPRSNVILDTWSNSLSYSYKLQYNPHLTKTTNSNGSVSYAFSSDDTFTLQNQAASPNYGTLSISYSENGKYALFSRNTMMTRVNLDTKMLLTVPPAGGTQEPR